MDSLRKGNELRIDEGLSLDGVAIQGSVMRNQFRAPMTNCKSHALSAGAEYHEGTSFRRSVQSMAETHNDDLSV